MIKILFGLVAFTSQAVAWASLDVDDTEKRCGGTPKEFPSVATSLALPLEDNKCRFKRSELVDIDQQEAGTLTSPDWSCFFLKRGLKRDPLEASCLPAVDDVFHAAQAGEQLLVRGLTAYVGFV
ncbi:MAG: hypothetical protein AAB425_03720, partial [Bdellovibrionota bacterium]